VKISIKNNSEIKKNHFGSSFSSFIPAKSREKAKDLVFFFKLFFCSLIGDANIYQKS
jgi:hypothetical protein